MTPQKIAKELARFYRANPTKWLRGMTGSKTHGCCILGGALEIGDENASTAGRFAMQFGKFLHAQGRITLPGGVIQFNDQRARDVNDVVDMLEEFAAT
jgi:hypothetical protein